MQVTMPTKILVTGTGYLVCAEAMTAFNAAKLEDLGKSARLTFQEPVAPGLLAALRRLALAHGCELTFEP